MPGSLVAAVSLVHAVRRRDRSAGRGVRLTSLSRTLVDLTRYVDGASLAAMIEQVLSNGTCSAATLVRTAERLNTPERPWARRFLGVLGRRLPGGGAESTWEVLVGEASFAAGLTDIRRQVEVDLPNVGRGRFDLGIPAIRWAVEIDVHPSHHSPGGRARDEQRDRAAASIGWVVERVVEVDLRDRFGATVSGLVTSAAARRTDLAAAG